jgi:hypothetical protein
MVGLSVEFEIDPKATFVSFPAARKTALALSVADGRSAMDYGVTKLG